MIETELKLPWVNTHVFRWNLDGGDVRAVDAEPLMLRSEWANLTHALSWA